MIVEHMGAGPVILHLAQKYRAGCQKAMLPFLERERLQAFNKFNLSAPLHSSDLDPVQLVNFIDDQLDHICLVAHRSIDLAAAGKPFGGEDGLEASVEFLVNGVQPEFVGAGTFW